MTSPLHPDWTPDAIILARAHRWLEGREPAWIRFSPLLGAIFLAGIALWAMTCHLVVPVTCPVQVGIGGEDAGPRSLVLIGPLPEPAAAWRNQSVTLQVTNAAAGRRWTVTGTLTRVVPRGHGLWLCQMVAAAPPPPSLRKASGLLERPGRRVSLAALVWQRIRLPGRRMS